MSKRRKRSLNRSECPEVPPPLLNEKIIAQPEMQNRQLMNTLNSAFSRHHGGDLALEAGDLYFPGRFDSVA